MWHLLLHEIQLLKILFQTCFSYFLIWSCIRLDLDGFWELVHFWVHIYYISKIWLLSSKQELLACSKLHCWSITMNCYNTNLCRFRIDLNHFMQTCTHSIKVFSWITWTTPVMHDSNVIGCRLSFFLKRHLCLLLFKSKLKNILKMSPRSTQTNKRKFKLKRTVKFYNTQYCRVSLAII